MKLPYLEESTDIAFYFVSMLRFLLCKKELTKDDDDNDEYTQNDHDADDYKWNLQKAKMSSGIENHYDTKVICFINFKSIQLVKFTKGKKDNHTLLHVTTLELD